MLGIAAELENVPLRQPQVFEQHPGSVRKVRGLCPAQLRRQALYNIFELGVGAPASKKFEKMSAQRLFVIFGHPSLR
jgi:hypothetical protein